MKFRAEQKNNSEKLKNLQNNGQKQFFTLKSHNFLDNLRAILWTHYISRLAVDLRIYSIFPGMVPQEPKF